MKNTILVIALILTILAPRAKAQETVMDEINYEQLERFIQMAKDYYPQRRIFSEEESQAKNTLAMANISYLDLFNANYYYRPNDRQTINVDNPYVTNGFQFGVSINLGTYLQKPLRSKNARSDLEIARLEKEMYDKELEKEVKNRYYNYVYQLKELKIKTAAAQDVNATALDITNRFERGELTLEEYNTARAALSNADSSKMQTEINYLRAKDDLEDIIGTTLVDATN